jgi:arylsulfatase A-like enzyme
MPNSLVLITVDCLRADHVGFLGYDRATTQFLDSLAKESFVFPEAIAAGVPTYYSFPAILASRYPLALGRDIVGLAPQEPTIATVLKRSGYATAAFIAGNPYLGARFGYGQGFDEFQDFLRNVPLSESPSSSRRGVLSSLNHFLQAKASRASLTATAYEELYFRYCQWRARNERVSLDTLRRYPAADVVVNEACTWLRGLGGKPFFLWLHFMDPHHPYYPPEEALSSRSPDSSAQRARFLNSFWRREYVSLPRLRERREEVIALYDAGVHWVDRQISQLVKVLQQTHHWDHSILAVTADHGEEFLEHGARYHHPVHLPEQLIHVPLLLRSPLHTCGRLSDVPFSLLHLAPTLLDMVGAPTPASFQGRTQWAQIAAGTLPDEPVIVECIAGCTNPFRRDGRIGPRLMAVRGRQYKLIINFGENKEILYDLKADRGETSALPANALKQERARLLEAARKHLQEMEHQRNDDLRLRAQLRELQCNIQT